MLATLEAFKAQDLDWRKGRTWAYVYPVEPAIERVGKQAYLSYLTENALDPTVFPSCLILENQLVAIGAAHLGGDEDVAGNFTSGGTESILMAVKTARDRARALRPEITTPQMVLPVTAHAAFHKAAAYFDVELVLVEVDPTTYRATAEAVRDAMTDQTILVVASAPSYAHGVIDDVAGIAAVAEERGVLCHVDACMGGWLLPYLKRAGADVLPFDFSVPGVTSISMDLHKYAFCPKGASLILHRSRALREHQIFSCSNWTGYTIVNPTFQSTKTGGPLAGAWATLHAIGDEGYLAHARTLHAATRQLVEGCRAIDGVEVMGEPEFLLVACTSEEVDVFHVTDEMKKRGWYVQPQLGYGDHRANFHFSMNLGVAPHVGEMLGDLADAVEAARALGPQGLADRARRILSTMDAGRLSDEGFQKLLDLAGIRGADLPERMAGINEILDALPVKTNEALLRRFFGELNHLSPEQRAMIESVRRAVGASDASPSESPARARDGVLRRVRGRLSRGLRQASRVAVGIAALGNKAAEQLAL